MTDKKENSETPKQVSEKFKTEKCNILLYNPTTKELDVDFRGYGIRFNDVERLNSETIVVKYRGTIGKPNFICRL